MKHRLHVFLLSTILMLTLHTVIFADAPEIDFSGSELVFSGVKAKDTLPDQTFIVTNTGTAPLTISAISIGGTDAPDFSLVNPPVLPLVLDSLGTLTLTVHFKPRSTEIGIQAANLTIVSNDADEASRTFGLYGLSANGLEGGNEPSFHRVASTLGYTVNVGGTGLLLPKTPAPIGDELLMPLMQKAGSGVVTIKAVARYSPHMQIPYGYYLPNGSSPIRFQVGAISPNVAYSQQYPPNHQTLNPRVDAGTQTTFDPGTEPFGIYVFGLDSRYTYTEDALNVTNPLLHSARIYPLKNRQGTPIPNTYLIGFEDASNGDYQDYVFVVSNVVPAAGVVTPTPTPTPSLPLELIANGGLENDSNGDNLPDNWTFENLTNDMHLCNAATAYAGNCAWKFVSGTAENAVLSQSKTAPANMDAGDTVRVNLYTKATTGVTGILKVVIVYADTTLGRDFIDIRPTASGQYQQVTGRVTLRGKVKLVRFLVRHRSIKTNVELWVDNVSLIWTDGGEAPLASTIAMPIAADLSGTLSSPLWPVTLGLPQP